MKAVRVHSIEDEPRIEEVPPPEVLGDHEVLVRIHDAGVNSTDFALSFTPSAAPRTLGRDFSGQVMEVGDAVKGFSRGDRVFGFADGSYAEFAAIPASALARMPRSADFDEAAALPTPALTAYQLMMHEVQACEGQSVIVHGMISMVGSLCSQLAEWQGARVITERARQVDAVVDLVGGAELERFYPVVREGGVIVSIAGRLDEDELSRRGIRGVQFAMQPSGVQLGIVARLVDAGILQPRLGRVLPLAEARLAWELVHAQGVRSKIVLSVSHP